MEVIKVASREINVGLQSNLHLDHLYLDEFHAWYFRLVLVSFFFFFFNINTYLCSSWKSKFHLYYAGFQTVACEGTCFTLCSPTDLMPWLY